MMRLQGKSVVIYGANSPVGASVARAVAKEGATVILAGRSTARLGEISREISSFNGSVEVAQVDPMDPKSVSEHLHQVVVAHGSVDVSLNLAFLGIPSSSRLCNLDDEQFAAVALTRPRSNFVTAAAAASEMGFQGKGLIVATSVPEGAAPGHLMAGQRIGSAAIEELCNQLRRDVGSFGVKIAFLANIPSSGEEFVQELVKLWPSTASRPASPPESALAAPASTHFPTSEAPTGAATSLA
jgi:3-oxoacyl-[acyl-carrier protein] reductase